jgi:hypothetical protein
MRHVLGFLRVLLPLIGLGALLIGVHYVLGHDPGAPCAQDYECRYAWNGACLHTDGVDPYCSRSCTTNTDCPTSWTCEPIVTERIQHGMRSVAGGDRACVRPSPSAKP